MLRAMKIVIEMPDGSRKVDIVRSVDEAFRLCRFYGGVDWKPISYRPHLNRVGL